MNQFSVKTVQRYVRYKMLCSQCKKRIKGKVYAEYGNRYPWKHIAIGETTPNGEISTYLMQKILLLLHFNALICEECTVIRSI